MEVVIKFPSNFQQERSYTLNILFSYFENVQVKLIPENRNDYEMSYNNKVLTIEDHFWKDLSESAIDELWRQFPKAPKNVSVAELDASFISTYGEPLITFSDDNVLLKSDIIASSFFFLSRWEEWVSDKRDKHDRFPDDESYLIQHKLHQKPVVNEYIDFLKRILSHFSGEEISYNRSYRTFITHDVDEIYRYRPLIKWVKAIAGDLITRKDPISACKSFFKGLLSQFSKKMDDSQTFDYLMDISEKYDQQSCFYFIPGEKGEKDFRYSISSKPVVELIRYIHKRNHIIGIHPSYRSKENPNYFEEEVKRLRSIAPCDIEEGRHHYLRVNYPSGLKQWQNNDLRVDSSLGYHNYAGFRAGICYDFPVYDLDNRSEMDVIQRPLTVMEIALERDTNSYAQFKKQIVELSQVVQKYDGDMVFLWHNNNIHHPAWKKLGRHYEEIVRIIAK